MIKFTMKTNYLQAMGIVSWQLRRANTPGLRGYYNYYLSASGDGDRRAVLLCQAGENSQQEQELLSALIQALGWYANAAPASPDFAGISWIIFLGTSPNSLPAANAAIVATASLAEMITNPLLKAKVWQALRTIRE